MLELLDINRLIKKKNENKDVYIYEVASEINNWISYARGSKDSSTRYIQNLVEIYKFLELLSINEFKIKEFVVTDSIYIIEDLIYDITRVLIRDYRKKIIKSSMESINIELDNQNIIGTLNQKDQQLIFDEIEKLKSLIKESEILNEQQKNRLLYKLSKLKEDISSEIKDFDKLIGLVVETELSISDDKKVVLKVKELFGFIKSKVNTKNVKFLMDVFEFGTKYLGQ